MLSAASLPLLGIKESSKADTCSVLDTWFPVEPGAGIAFLQAVMIQNFFLSRQPLKE